MSGQTPIQFYLNGKRSVAELETVEISHPDFSKTYRFVRNHMDGIKAVIENDEYVEFEYRPVIFEILGFKDDLDQKINVSLGTLGEVLPMELKRLRENNGFLIKPSLIYRTYASDNLDHILQGPINLLATEFVSREKGTGITAQAENISTARTGEIYDLNRFFMLRGFI